jgi:flagellar M-ring protein FliF
VPAAQPNFLTQLVTIWTRLQATQRATIVLFTLLALTGLGVLIFFMNRVDYVVLYRDLSPEDAQAIAAHLKDLKKDYQVSADGTTIEVAGSTSDVDKLRLDIAGAGLAHSGRVGYEIFDKTQFGMTDFTEQVNYKRALEGELGRTISSLSEVSEARVHLVLPKDSLFDDQKEEAKASVFVRLKRGKELPKNSIGGIVNLVAGAVQGLHTYNVSVVDGEGRVLSPLLSGDSAHSEYETGIQNQMEKELIAKVTSILEPVVGTGKVHANASIDLDFNSSEQTEETYNPNPPPVILSHQKSEERTGSAAAPAGVPGTRSNQGGQPVQASAASPEHTRQSESTNYEVSRLVRHTVEPKGSIRRLSVAVLLDNKAVYSKDSKGEPVTTFQPRSKEELDRYRELVLATVGYDEKRGDIVTLENMPFFTEPGVGGEQTASPWYAGWLPYLMPAMKYMAFIALFLLAYRLLFVPMRKRILQAIALAPQIAQPAPPRQLGEAGTGAAPAMRGAPPLAAAAPATNAALPGSGLEGMGGPSEADIEEELLRETAAAGAGYRKYDVLKKKVVEHASRDPEQMSHLIRTWIHESHD